MTQDKHTVNRGNRFTIIAVAVVFLAPIVGAYILHATGWQPESTKNRGALVPGPVAMAEQHFNLANGGSLALKDIRHSWGVLYIGGDSCDPDCVERLERLRRAHISLGKNQPRVHRLYLARSATHDYQALGRQFPELKILAAPEAGIVSWRAQLKDAVGGDLVPGMMFIIDPLGNAILNYRADADPVDVRKDLGRLLHVSRLG
ncbi:MAG: hypothetical protein OEZ10_10505 [Gammaproteobacteria bacterium]|nr:hypothetical protein [Gammaproteobacteria bacterium]